MTDGRLPYWQLFDDSAAMDQYVIGVKETLIELQKENPSRGNSGFQQTRFNASRIVPYGGM